MNKKVLLNIFSLLSIQGVGYILPLITLPYLVRILGPNNYGVYGYSLAIIQYSILIIDFGFNLTVTKKISLNRDDKLIVSSVFWNVMACKLLLCIFTFLITVAWSRIDNTFAGDNLAVLMSSYTMVIGILIFPIWLFQGKEEITKIALINISSKFLTVPLIFILIDKPSDGWKVGLINGSGYIVAGIIGLHIVSRRNWIVWVKPTFSQMFREYASAWHIFISNASINIYTSSITVILGALTSPVTVGYFVAADKIRLAFQGLINPVSQALYPRINALMKESPAAGFKTIRLLLKTQGVFFFFCSGFIFYLSPNIISFLYGESYKESIPILKILAWLPFIIAISNVLGYQTLLVLNMERIFSRLVLVGGGIALVIIFPLIIYFGGYGAALTILIAEVSVNLLMLTTLIKKKIPIFKGQ
ncbi:flippase [Escherichia coli]|nr:flippase [Escherichia coli]HAI5537675.1 O173 family O-antigen flippase [Escherichia coli]